MKQINTYPKWIEIGYELFALEGESGIQIERLARIINLNKSGFYHYFDTKENYFDHLMDYHLKLADGIKTENHTSKYFDPDFLNLMVKNKTFFLVQMQLFLNKHTVLFKETFNKASAKYLRDIIPLWSEYVGIPKCSELSIRYFIMTQSTIYSQLTSKTLTYIHLQKMVNEAKSLAQMMMDTKRSYTPSKILKNGSNRQTGEILSMIKLKQVNGRGLT